MKSLEKDGITVKEYYAPDRREFTLMGHDAKTGMQYQQQIPMQEATLHPEIVVHVLEKMRNQLRYERERVMGVDWTPEASPIMGIPNWREHAHIPKYDRQPSGTKFKRLGEDAFLEEGANFQEPLDALRINVAKWLKGNSIYGINNV